MVAAVPDFWNTKRKSKYGAKRIIVDGVTFDSRKEARRYQALKLEERAGTVRKLAMQVPFACSVSGKLICRYIADFTYEQLGPDGQWSFVVEDVKGYQTAEFKLKRKLVEALHGVSILLT